MAVYNSVLSLLAESYGAWTVDNWLHGQGSNQCGALPSRPLSTRSHPHGDLDEMYKIVAEMRQRGCEPDLVTFNILLFAHLKADVRLHVPAVQN